MFSSHVQEYCLATALYSRQVDVDEFCSAVPFDESFSRCLFKYFDKNGDGWLRLSSVVQYIGEFESLPPIKKLRYIFEVTDVEGTGLLTMPALHKYLKLWADVQSSGLTCSQTHSVASSIFTSLGNTNLVSFEEVIVKIEDNKALMSVIMSLQENQLVSSTKPLANRKTRTRRLPFKLPRRFCSYKYISYNIRKILMFLLIFLLNIFMTVYGGWKYRESNWFVIVARGCGASLNLAVTLVIIFMLRYWWTLLRRTWMAKYLPMDNFQMFHKMLGVLVALYSIVHTGAHIGNAGM
ncbi:NADPH oxidase 5-like [Antedon mediterranea]|uniref:NADPH oxidase 5-like n=1 Tax=Antedon mediterranea TaxID=105859 RepID=UPI003AF8B106